MPFATLDDCHDIIRRTLSPAFGEWLQCNSTRELHEHPLYRELKPQVDAVIGHVDCGDYRERDAPAKEHYRVVAWNIERGCRFEEQLAEFRHHPHLSQADVWLLIETDVGMARSGNRDVAREFARELGLAYAFAPCYLSMVKGSGVEYHVEGENDLGLHGNAVLSRYPIASTTRIALPNGRDKMRGREKRLGTQSALATRIALPRADLNAVAVHLDAQSSQRHRVEQMRRILDAMPGAGPVILGGDWNTSTYNSSHAFPAICGFWLRVFMGVDRVIRNHYLHPENLFERELFQLLEARGFDYRNANRMGERTTWYDMDENAHDQNLREWVPGWCFPFIHWALRNHDNKCPLKLDWFATRGVKCERPTVIHDVREGRAIPLSDHDAIAVDVRVE